ncbi:MAG: type II toxin-antitoxin system HipA family toxin, partial [Flavobacteriales bacterium]|nr:type II toxin-antitoxin system HipA family toxin [Flavobacteriales bacterium]
MTTAFVHLWDHRVGAIAWDEATGIGYFEYDPGFLSLQLDPAPFTMPVAQARQRVFSFPDLRNKDTFKGLPGMLADVLPDKYGHAVINSWLASQGRPPDSLTPVELLCFIGKRGMGALEFEPARPKTARQSSKLEIDSLIAVAEKILTGRNNFTTHLDPDEQKALSDILKIGTSAGGARAKAVIAFNPKTLEVRSGQAQVPKGFTHWILKFDGVTDTQFGASSGYGRVEMAYYNMAKDAGIDMTECRLLEENGRAHFMTRRFDRDDQGEKIHMQSLCALRHFDFNEMNLY